MRTRNKYLKGFVLSPVLVFIFITASMAFAETRTFTEESTYRASEFDNERACESLAFLQVKRQLFANLGAYLQREPKLKKDQNLYLTENEIFILQFTQDQFITLLSCVVRPDPLTLHHNWDGQKYFLVASIRTDPDEVKNSIKKLFQDKQKTKELNETKRKADEALKTADEALKTVEELKGLGITEAEKAEKKERAKSRYRAAIDKVGATDWFERACISITAGKKDAALDEYNNAINLDRGYAQAYYCRANVKSDIGKPRYEITDVISDYDEAIRADSKYVEAYIKCGNAKSKVGRYADAIRHYDQVITWLEPKNAQAYIGRGNARSKLGDKDAIRDCNEAISLDPKNAQSYICRGNARSILGDKDAIRDYKDAISLDPKNAQAYIGRGNARSILGDRDAIRDCNEAIRLEPKNPQAYICRGNARSILGDRDAIRDYKDAISLDPKCAEAYYSRGIAYDKLREQQQAISDMRVAARMGYIPAQDWLKSKRINY